MIRRRFLSGALAAGATAAMPRRSGAATAEPLPARIGALAAADYLGRQDFMRYDVGDVHAVHYADVATAYGALRLAAATRDTALRAGVAARHARLVAAALPNTANHVDANVYGVWPLELARQTGDRHARALGLTMADGQWRQTTPDGLTAQARYWIDDVWMIGALQLQAWRATRTRLYLDRAALMARLYLARLQEPNGLFHHGTSAPHFWARGNGWVAAGLAEILSELPAHHPDHAGIEAGYRRMMAALLAHQADDGLWHQLIDHSDAWTESSGSAMFGFAIARGVRRGVLMDPAYARASHKAWAGLAARVGPNGKLAGICIGTAQSQDAAYYLGRPTVIGDLHGQAALLWFAAELSRAG
jgi:rhamnogalacturonyl hydrolase YesR